MFLRLKNVRSYREPSNDIKKAHVAKFRHFKPNLKKVREGVKQLDNIERYNKNSLSFLSSGISRLNISINHLTPTRVNSITHTIIRENSNNLSLNKESARIRQSMEAYEVFSKNKRKTVPDVNFSCVDIKSQLKKLSNKITCLMRREIIIKDIYAGDLYDIKMKAGSCKQYCIPAKMKPTPLRMRIEVETGIGGARILLSQGVLRPSISNCDKVIMLSLKEVNAVYSTNREKLFTHENVYMTIETTKNTLFSFQCGFGRGTLII